MKLNLGNRLYGVAKGFLGASLISTGVTGFPWTQIVGGGLLLAGKLIGSKNILGNGLQRIGDALLTAPVSGGWFAAEAVATIVTGNNVVMGVTKINSKGEEKVRGAGYILTDVIPQTAKIVGEYLGIIKPQSVKVNSQNTSEKDSLLNKPTQNLSPSKTPRRFVVINKGQSK
jgi:hypothetical protein